MGLLRSDKSKRRAPRKMGEVEIGQTATRAVVTPTARSLKLTVIRGIDRGRTLELGAFKSVRIGSHPSNELCLLDRHVSRFHCEIVAQEHGWEVRDLESTNGTHLDQRPVKEAPLMSGSQLRVGHTVLEVAAAAGGPDGEGTGRFGAMVGGSAVMTQVFEALQRVAADGSTCLLLGEVGTGKALAARAIHEHSDRQQGPFLVVDCGAVGPQFLEDKLFGHQRGKFTGDSSGVPGIFEEAAGGTVFLDAVGELPLSIQPRLLDVLERRVTTRLGSRKPISLDVRVVAATHRNMMSMVRAGQFRQDLLYRISDATIRLPPLRERRDDIGELANALLREEGLGAASLTADAVEYLQTLPWHGNVRELRNFLRRSAMLNPEPVIERAALESDRSLVDSPDTTSQYATLVPPPFAVELVRTGDESPEARWLDGSLQVATDQFRHAYFRRLRERFGEDVKAAAAHAGVHPKIVARFFRHYDV